MTQPKKFRSTAVVPNLGMGKKRGKQIYSAEAVRRIFRLDEHFRDKATFNESDEWIYWKNEKLCDLHIAEIRGDICVRYGWAGSYPLREDVRAGIISAAMARPVNPIKERLESLVWDGKPRIRNIVPQIFGAEDVPIYTRIMECTLISAIARVYKPGCKVHLLPILVGAGGIGKSTFWEILAGGVPAYGEAANNPRTFFSRDAIMARNHSWIVEIGEIDKLLMRASEAQLKNLLTIVSDVYRRPYARDDGTYPRKHILVGTSNIPDMLRDLTGNRRYGIIPCTKIDIERWRAECDVTLAEAKMRYLANDSWWLSQKEEEQLNEIYRASEMLDPLVEEVKKYMQNRDVTTTAEILTALNLNGCALSHNGRKISMILIGLGYIRSTRGKWRKSFSEQNQ